MSGEVAKPGELLTEQAPRVSAFLNVVFGQLDHAVEENGNHGNLILPTDHENIYAAKWLSIPPKLPDKLYRLLPFDEAEPVMIHARYGYGTELSRINIWIGDIKGDYRFFDLALVINTRHDIVQHNGVSIVSPNVRRNIIIGVQDVKSVMDGIFAGNYEYRTANKSLDLFSLYKMGVASQSEYGAETYTFETANKKLAVPSRINSIVIKDGFKLSVSNFDRTHPNNKPSTTVISLEQKFEADEYFYFEHPDGMLIRELRIEQDNEDKITGIKRSSDVEFFGNTILTELPEDLANKRYPNASPTLDDLDFFERLIVKPIKLEDCYI